MKASWYSNSMEMHLKNCTPRRNLVLSQVVCTLFPEGCHYYFSLTWTESDVASRLINDLIYCQIGASCVTVSRAVLNCVASFKPQEPGLTFVVLEALGRGTAAPRVVGWFLPPVVPCIDVASKLNEHLDEVHILHFGRVMKGCLVKLGCIHIGPCTSRAETKITKERTRSREKHRLIPFCPAQHTKAISTQETNSRQTLLQPFQKSFLKIQKQ